MIKKIISATLLLVTSIFLVACDVEDDPSTQVTNSTMPVTGLAIPFSEVTVANVSFFEYLDDVNCPDCATGFKDVPEGYNTISYQITGSTGPVTIGDLGPFEMDTKYSVVMTQDIVICAELWLRYQTDSTVSNDTSSELIDTVCEPVN